jgi:hypothetical protein
LVLGVREDPQGARIWSPRVGATRDEAAHLLADAAHRVEPPLEVEIREGRLDDAPIYVAEVPQRLGAPYIAPDGAVVRRGDRGEPIPLTAPELALSFEDWHELQPPPEVELLETLNRRVDELQRTLDAERSAAAAERSAQELARTQAAHEKRLPARVLEWTLAGLVGALISALIALLI